MFERFSIPARQVVFVARLEAGEAGAAAIDTEHLLLGLVTVHPELFQSLSAGVDPDGLKTAFGRWRGAGEPVTKSVDMPLTPDSICVLEAAVRTADVQNCQEIRTEHMLFALMEEGGHAGEFLRERGLDKGVVETWVAGIDCSTIEKVTKTAQLAMDARVQAMQ